MTASKTLSATPVSFETKLARANARARFEGLLASLPTTPHPTLVNARMADTSDMFDFKFMSIHQFRHLYDHLVPVSIQRDHLRRIDNDEVGYLSELHLTHTNYMVVVEPETVGLGDGNTRTSVYFVAENKALLPSHVGVLVYYPDNAEMARDVYYCTDSQVNSKRTRHEISGSMRHLGIELLGLEDSENARLVRDGYLTSAYKRLARVHGLRYPMKDDEVRRETVVKVTELYLKQLPWLATWNFTPKEMSQGFYAAMLYLKRQAPDSNEVDTFFKELRSRSAGTMNNIPDSILELFSTLAALYRDARKGFNGETAVDVVFALTVRQFDQYLLGLTVNRTAAERKRLLTLAANITPLPTFYSNKLKARGA